MVVTVVMFLGIWVTPASGVLTAANSRDIALRSGGGWSFNPAEQCLMRKINKVRRHSGRPGLYWDRQMGFVARRHANRMAANGYVFHDGNIGQEITRWRSLGQNSGAGFSCRSLHRAFMRSSSHRYNILAGWRHIAVGAEWRNGRLYVQEVFESRYDPGNVYRYP
jgi:uncharacterized protein YkwD